MALSSHARRCLLGFLTLCVPACSAPEPNTTNTPGPTGGTNGVAGQGVGGSIAGAGGSVTSGGMAGSVGAGSGNMAGAGGSGAVASGGSAGAGAAAGIAGGPAGAAGTGTAGTAGVSGSAGTGSMTCNFQVTPTMSTAIPTVAIVEWSVDRTAIDSATIEFGLDTTYGMSAPVDLAEPNKRTLLLGMKASSTYHFRVVAVSGGQSCASSDFTVMTGEPPNTISAPDVETNVPVDQLQGGFTITSRWGMNNDGPAIIIDAEGDLVWWYPGEIDVIRTRKSFDGKKMWIRNTAQTNGQGVVMRVTMDGLNEERWELPNTTHDLAVIPDGNIGLIGHASDGCDEILVFNPETEVLTPIFNAREVTNSSDCHVNYLAYSAADDTFTFSDYTSSTFIKITRTGELVWALNGTNSDFTGTNWSRQHGIHLIAPDHVLIFSNGAPGSNSPAIEYQLDLMNFTATELWRYDGGESAQFGGDIQRLENGNTLITYSSAGVIHEVNQQKQLLQSMSWNIGDTVAFSERVDSLYGGPPPRIY